MSYLSNEPGHLGNLTESQTAALKEMWTYLLCGYGYDLINLDEAYEVEPPSKKKGGLFGRNTAKPEVRRPREIVNAISKSLESAPGQKASREELLATLQSMMRFDHPDTLLLRFMRARKWELVKALEMLGHTFHWRLTEGHVDDILFEGEGSSPDYPNEELLFQWQKGKCYTRGVDKKGRPLVFVNVKMHWPKDQSQENIKKFTIQVIESVRLCLIPPVETAAVVFDLSDFVLGNMDYGAVKFIIQCFEAHYPECLGFLLIHNAPWVFNGVWNIVKGLIDPVVAAKISFTKNIDDIRQFLDDEHIPKHLGGSRQEDYEYIEPFVNENKHLKDEATRAELTKARVAALENFFDATIKWIRAEPGKDTDVAQAEKNRAADLLSQSYWKLDSYVRAKCVYDRDGTFEYFKPNELPRLEPSAGTPVINEGVEKLDAGHHGHSAGQTITA